MIIDMFVQTGESKYAAEQYVPMYYYVLHWFYLHLLISFPLQKSSD